MFIFVTSTLLLLQETLLFQKKIEYELEKDIKCMTWNNEVPIQKRAKATFSLSLFYFNSLIFRSPTQRWQQCFNDDRQARNCCEKSKYISYIHILDALPYTNKFFFGVVEGREFKRNKRQKKRKTFWNINSMKTK